MKKFIIFCSGFLLGALFFGATVSDATTGQKNVIAKYANIKVVVDGKRVATTDEPFTMGGKTYVPLRLIGEALGKNVGWENNTVLVGTEKQSLLLIDLIKPTETGVKTSSGIGTGITVAGKSYSRGFYVEGQKNRQNGSLKFFVQGTGMKKVTGSLALDDANEENMDPVSVEILQDSEVIWKGTLKRGSQPIQINIPITAATNNLYFNFDNMNNSKIDFINFLGQY